LSSVLQALVLGRVMSKEGKQYWGFFMASPSQADLVAIKELLETGKVIPAIDKCYPLCETADAMRSFESHAKGKIVITA
jgi:NADPH:quinone reductase-like Zn-dependent oxidoreductase